MSAAQEIWVEETHGDLLVRELSHRFCNTLQIIGAHLSQVEPNQSPEWMARKIGSVRDRIGALSRLHERLGCSRAGGQAFESYCREICVDLAQCFGRSDLTVCLCMEATGLGREAERSLVYLIVELVTNAVMHCRNDGAGVIWIDLRRSGEAEFELSVRDNGHADPCVISAISPGMVAIWANSLGGEVRISQQSGFAAQVRFPAHQDQFVGPRAS